MIPITIGRKFPVDLRGDKSLLGLQVWSFIRIGEQSRLR